MHLALPDTALLSAVRISYQPIVRLADGGLDHVEVLARSADDDGTLRGPERLLKAMRSGTGAMRVTEAIITRTLAEYERFGFAAHGLPVAFNLSLDALLHPDLTELIERLRMAAGLRRELIRFELTEDQPVHDLAAAEAVVTRMRLAGYALALDDITPGMPYLAALLDMPFTTIKFDRSVVISPGRMAQDFLRELSAYAARRGQHSIAEGIETAQVDARMRASRMTHAQGYLYARPLPAGALHAYLNPA